MSASYPLDHSRGYVPLPRDAARFEPLMRSDNLMRCWLLLCCRARHEAGWVTGSHGNVHLQRGQCVCGVREIGEILAISKTTAHRTMQELERLGLIVVDAGQRGTVVSITNYGSFGQIEESIRDSAGTEPGQPRDSRGTAPGPKERKNGKTGKRKNRTTSPAAVPLPFATEASPEPGTPEPTEGEQPGEERQSSSSSTEEGKGAGGGHVGKGQISDHSRVRERYAALYQQRYGGTRPTWGAPEGALLKRLIDQHGADVVIQRAERLFTSPPDWIQDGEEGGAFTFRRFTSSAVFDALAATGPSLGEQRREQRRQTEAEQRRQAYAQHFEDWGREDGAQDS